MANFTNTPMTIEYAFTVTLRPKMYSYPASDQLALTARKLVLELGSLAGSNDFCVIAELTKTYNVHYHGIIRFPLGRFVRPMEAFHNFFRKLYASTPHNGCFAQGGSKGIDIRPVSDFNGWKEYLCKDMKESKVILKTGPIIYNGNKLFTDDEYYLQ